MQNNQAVSNQPIRSGDQTFMLNTITTTVPSLPRLPLAPPNIVGTHSLSSTNRNPFQRNINLNAIANPCQRLYQTHTEPNIGSFATLRSSSSTVIKTINICLVITQNYFVTFVEKKKSVKTNDGIDHQNTTENYLNPLAFKQWHKTKMAYIQCSLSGIT